MDIINGKKFCIYTENLIAKPVNLQKIVIVTSASNAPACIVDARDDEDSRSESSLQNMTQRDKNEDDNLINTEHYKPPESSDE